MRKILLITAFIVILIFNGQIWATGGNGTVKSGLTPINRTYQNDLVTPTLIESATTEELNKPATEDLLLPTPTAVLPPQYFCDFIDYSGGEAYVYSLLPDDDYPIENYIGRITPAEGYYCTLLSVCIGVYGPAHVGTPGLYALLYDSNRDPIDSVLVDWPDIEAVGFGYVCADFSTANGGSPYVFTDGEEFHIGLAVVTDGDDTLAFLAGDVDTDTEDRYSFRLWDDWYAWTSNRAYLFGADICCGRIPYSSCYRRDTWCDATLYFDQVEGTDPDYYISKFNLNCPETLKTVGCALYDPSLVVGTPDLEFYVWPDNGSGFPDIGNEIYTETIPYENLKYWGVDGSWNVIDLSSLDLEFRGEFYIGWGTAGDPGESLPFLGDETCGLTTTLVGYASDGSSSVIGYDFLMYVYLCKDEFCACKVDYDYCNESYIFPLPDRYGDIGAYQLFSTSGAACRLEGVRFRLDYLSYDNPGVDAYTFNSEVQILDTDGGNGLPGTKLLDTTITPADYVLWPGWFEVDLEGLSDPFLFDEDIWVGIESFAPDTLTGIRIDIDDGSCGDYRSAENWNGTIGYVADDWDGWDFNWVIEISVCCTPPPPPPNCYEEDWTTFGKTFERTFSTGNSLGDDPQGNLTKVWEYDADQYMVYGQPVGYNDTVVGYFLDQVVALDLNTGAEIWKRTSDGFEIGSGVFNTPTIYNFADFGTDVTLVFVPGGDTKAFSALNLTDGSTYWTNNFTFHSNHFTTFGVCVIVDVAGEPVLIYADDDGDVYAVNALTGTLYSGWTTNPMNYGGEINQGLSSDGTNIYIGTLGNVTNGNIICADGATGTVIWDLASGAGNQLGYLDPDNDGTEDFTGAIAYDDNQGYGVIYAASYYSVDNVPPYNSGGVMYALDAASGMIKWAALCIEQDYGGIAVDNSQIIHTGWTPWVPGYGVLRGPTGFSKYTGAYTFRNTTTNPGLGDFWLMGGVKTCEPEIPDYFVTQSRNDFLGFYRTSDGAMMFHRRWSSGERRGHRTCPTVLDGRLLATWGNKVVLLQEDSPRPRLDLPSYEISVPVEFGAPDHYQVVFPNAIGNTGGAPLTINSITLVDSDNGTIPPASASINIVSEATLNNMEKIATKFAGNADRFRASMKDSEDNLIENLSIKRSNSAFALPSWIYGVVSPFPMDVISPQGEYNDSSNYVPIVVEINGTEVPRGLVAMYAEIDTDDPDYFLDDGAPLPMIQLNIVGGCLEESVELTFGVGAANFWTIFNTTTLADGDITTCEIDGDGASFWQGAYIFAAEHPSASIPGTEPSLFSASIFWNTADWGYGQEFESILADPNCYDATCPPNHRTNILLGEISNDNGATYEEIYGEVASFAFVDSAQDFCIYDTLGNCTQWYWPLGLDEVVPYNDTLTAKFHGCCEVIGAYDQPLLNNFLIHRFEFGGRYSAVDNIYIGAFIDWDIGPNLDVDVAGYDASHSVGWGYECNDKSIAWGAVKIPFGCGYDPMLSAKSCAAGQTSWEDTAYNFLDSMYYWLSTETGLSHQAGIDPTTCSVDPDDRDGFLGIANIDMPFIDDGSTTLGVAWFGLPDVADASDPTTFYALASTANKWCGFGRGDVNNDDKIDLADIAYIIDYVYYGGNGPYPFEHLADVNVDGVTDGADVTYMIDYYFNYGSCIQGEWMLGGF